MIKNRLAGTAALVTFGLAALGAALSAGAAPANAETGAAATNSSSDSSTSSSSSHRTAKSGASTTSGTTSPSGTPSRADVPTAKVGSTPTSGVSSSGGSMTPSESTKAISEATAEVRAKLNALRGEGENINIVQMFEMQMLMNKLSQLSDMSTSVVSASNQPTTSMARNVKS